MRMLNIVLVALLGIFLTAGCGESACEEFGSKLCELACDCTDGSECKISQGGATLTFDNGDDCRALYVTFGCPREEDGIDFAACSEELDSASCVDTGDGTMAIEMPDAPVCNGA